MRNCGNLCLCREAAGKSRTIDTSSVSCPPLAAKSVIQVRFELRAAAYSCVLTCTLRRTALGSVLSNTPCARDAVNFKTARHSRMNSNKTLTVIPSTARAERVLDVYLTCTERVLDAAKRRCRAEVDSPYLFHKLSSCLARCVVPFTRSPRRRPRLWRVQRGRSHGR